MRVQVTTVQYFKPKTNEVSSTVQTKTLLLLLLLINKYANNIFSKELHVSCMHPYRTTPSPGQANSFMYLSEGERLCVSSLKSSLRDIVELITNTSSVIFSTMDSTSSSRVPRTGREWELRVACLLTTQVVVICWSNSQWIEPYPIKSV